MNPTQSDIAAAKEISSWAQGNCGCEKCIAKAAGDISRHMQPERELLCELADMDCFQPWGCFCARLTGGEKPCIVCRARRWKKEQGL